MDLSAWVELREYVMLAGVGVMLVALRGLVVVAQRVAAPWRRAAQAPEPDETPTAPFWRPARPARGR